ncbi:hypothetical protein NC653_010108 [Populus alba x Populus x berolinensis]|uniref:Uncharacterized protein n=1 Tax=Populus alba x Populus x berolinensis TaxID=444605 RepID=A0AAD6W4W5_9ROSI|nr:hypothetical protein NC653_010108 [Populus alba x Populus x berolinensis]
MGIDRSSTLIVNKTCLALVADETASVHFQFWGDECDAFEPGDIICLANGIFSYNRNNNLVLRAGRRGAIKKVGEFTMTLITYFIKTKADCNTPKFSDHVPFPYDYKLYPALSFHSISYVLLALQGLVGLGLPEPILVGRLFLAYRDAFWWVFSLNFNPGSSQTISMNIYLRFQAQYLPWFSGVFCLDSPSSNGPHPTRPVLMGICLRIWARLVPACRGLFWWVLAFDFEPNWSWSCKILVMVDPVMLRPISVGLRLGFKAWLGLYLWYRHVNACFNVYLHWISSLIYRYQSRPFRCGWSLPNTVRSGVYLPWITDPIGFGPLGPIYVAWFVMAHPGIYWWCWLIKAMFNGYLPWFLVLILVKSMVDIISSK